MKTTPTILALALACVAIGALPGCSKKPAVAVGPPAKQIIGTPAESDPVAIKITWLDGTRYRFRAETVEDMDLNLPMLGAQTMAMASSHDLELLANAKLPDGGREFDLEITAQRFFIQTAEKNYLVVDSRQSAAEDAADPLSPLLRPLINAPIKCFMMDDKVVRTEGLDAITAKLKNGNPQFQAGLALVFTEDNLKKMFDVISAAQPADLVKFGGSWPVHLELDPPGMSPVVMDAQCKPTGWEMRDDHQCVHIEVKGNISAKPGATAEAGQTEIQSGTVSGDVWFDPQLGMLIHSSTTGHLDVTTTVMNQTLPAHVNLTSNFYLLAVEGK